mmetsp:Transcript_26518/g.33413  ORF Transcript_26518/g.33413 Transcript_26518/m.33413 type:complete len:290 (+) Transcript_26518:1-870(+)
MTFEGSKMVQKICFYVNGKCTGFLCIWNIYYWFGHTLIAFIAIILLAHAAIRLRPGPSLHRFWHVLGLYSLFCAIHSSADVLLELYFLTEKIKNIPNVSHRTNFLLHHPPYPYRAFWKLSLTFEWLIMGLLASSTKFKMFMWNFCASQASISLRDQNLTISNNWRHEMSLSFSDIFHNICGWHLNQNTSSEKTKELQEDKPTLRYTVSQQSSTIYSSPESSQTNILIKRNKLKKKKKSPYASRRSRRRDRAESGSSASSTSSTSHSFDGGGHLCRRDSSSGSSDNGNKS